VTPDPPNNEGSATYGSVGYNESAVDMKERVRLLMTGEWADRRRSAVRRRERINSLN